MAYPGYQGDPPQTVVDQVDAMLRDIDEECYTSGRPILSPIVRRADGRPGKAFWDSVEKFNLRLPGESDDNLIARLVQEGINFHGKPKS